MKPIRIQLKRSKGWRLPSNTVVVSRPSHWGNDFKVGSRYFNYETKEVLTVKDRADAVRLFTNQLWFCHGFQREIKRELRGKNLACWCPLDQRCHADVLLKIANEP